MANKIPVSKPRTYPSPGKCIYCGCADSSLSDEHIIPYALGGVDVIKSASCPSCAKITSSFEHTIARSLLGDFRNKHRLPTRRPKKRPTKVSVGHVDSDVVIDVPIEEFPCPALVYQCTPAGLFQDLPKNVDSSENWKPIVLVNEADMQEFQRVYGRGTTFKFLHAPEQFAKLLAKIAYCYAVANCGTKAFKPLVADLILGNQQNLGYYVGGETSIHPPIEGGKHILELEILADEKMEKALVVVRLRLFSSAETPTYHVIVGETIGVPETICLFRQWQQVQESLQQ